MKKLLLILFAAISSVAASAQFVARIQVNEEIPGICDKNEVYVLFPMLEGQAEAACPVTEAQILERLNAEVQFIKDNPKYKDKGMIGLIINCKGELVRCQMNIKTKTSELDKQIEAVFNSLGTWKAGILNSQLVDTNRLYSFSIKNGKFYFD